MTSPSLSPCDSASFGPIHAVGSHVIFVNGFGSSCSQPLFAKRPSQIVGSGRKMISRPAPEVGGWRVEVGPGVIAATGDEVAAPAAGAAMFPPSVVRPPASVPGTNPSWRTCFQKLSLLLKDAPVGSVIVQPPFRPAWARTQ